MYKLDEKFQAKGLVLDQRKWNHHVLAEDKFNDSGAWLELQTMFVPVDP
jgi:hypothetical protein